MVARTLLAVLVITPLAAIGWGVNAAINAAPQSVPAQCHFQAGGSLPDPTCTPGATNSAVTQSTISTTICVRGWTSTVRHPLSTTEPEKFRSMKAYGVPTTPGHAQLYEFDHLIPLELGGAVNSALNLWPEPHSAVYRGKQEGSFVKDALENRLNKLVCSGKMTLLGAQLTMATDWRKG